MAKTQMVKLINHTPEYIAKQEIILSGIKVEISVPQFIFIVVVAVLFFCIGFTVVVCVCIVTEAASKAVESRKGKG